MPERIWIASARVPASGARLPASRQSPLKAARRVERAAGEKQHELRGAAKFASPRKRPGWHATCLWSARASS